MLVLQFSRFRAILAEWDQINNFSSGSNLALDWPWFYTNTGPGLCWYQTGLYLGSHWSTLGTPTPALLYTPRYQRCSCSGVPGHGQAQYRAIHRHRFVTPPIEAEPIKAILTEYL